MSTHRHTVTALLADRPGAIDRVVSLVRKRRLRVDSLTVGRTEDDDLVRLTLVIEGRASEGDRLRLLLDKLIDVHIARTLDHRPHVRRDLRWSRSTPAPSIGRRSTSFARCFAPMSSTSDRHR